MAFQRVTIITHSVFVKDDDVFGPGHAVSLFLQNKKIPHTYLKHSLYTNEVSREVKYSSKLSSLVKSEKKYGTKMPQILNFPVQFVRTCTYLRKNPCKLCIAINPLNALAAIIMRRFGYVKTVIFYTADYALQRFTNPIINNFYHGIDMLALSNADVVWNTSTRITKRRKQQGLNEQTNRFVPNAPLISSLRKFQRAKKIPFSLVLMANFTKSIDYDLILNTAKRLSRKYTKLTISFIGAGEREEEIRDKVRKLRLNKSVIFHGFRSHDEALSIVAQHMISLAIYGGNTSWTEYGDSLKARESLGLGLPVIITDNVSTADDIAEHNAGFKISMKGNDLYRSIDALLKNRELYQSFAINAIALSKQTDLTRILNRELYVPYLKN